MPLQSIAPLHTRDREDRPSKTASNPRASVAIEQPFRSSRHASVQPMLVTRDLRANDHSPQCQIVGTDDTSKELDGVHPKIAW